MNKAEAILGKDRDNRRCVLLSFNRNNGFFCPERFFIVPGEFIRRNSNSQDREGLVEDRVLVLYPAGDVTDLSAQIREDVRVEDPLAVLIEPSSGTTGSREGEPQYVTMRMILMLCAPEGHKAYHRFSFSCGEGLKWWEYVPIRC